MADLGRERCYGTRDDSMASVIATNDATSDRPWARRPGRPAVSPRWSRLVGTSPAAVRLEQLIDRAAAVKSTVLVTGETGCGKEEIARAIHARGPRSDRPFVAINCGAMAQSLIESQLFGHERGSFTGAVGASPGVFRAADGGVVFLDEIGEMSLDLQPRLLRVLQEREVMPIGSSEAHSIDVQVIAATNRSLPDAVRRGEFREDLYFRLNTIEIDVPPLRDRAADIPLFVSHFCRYFAARFEIDVWEPDAATLDRLVRYRWPGNVRQLSQAIERLYALGDLPSLSDKADPISEPSTPARVESGGREADPEAPLPALNLETLRRIAVRQAMKCTDGHRGRAAALLGVHINTMTKLVEEALPEWSRRRRPKAK
jgi:transcriptional regulator with PAS, ATPase and Fis domain